MTRPGGMAWAAQLTHCKHGHSLEDAYVREEGWRVCRECNREAARNYKRRKRATWLVGVSDRTASRYRSMGA